MSTFRTISRLDLKGDSVIKGLQLEGLRKIGDPRLMAEKYATDGADEILIVDAVASLYGRNHLTEIIKFVVSDLRIPLTIVGGIRNLEDARTLFEIGADKIGINSAAIRNPSLISNIAEVYGSQSIVVSIEAKVSKENNSWVCMTENGRNPTGITVENWMLRLRDLGAGEVLVTSVDRDGMGKGPDFELCSAIREVTELPLIYSGGTSSTGDVLRIAEMKLDGVAVGRSLHNNNMSIHEIQSVLYSRGIFTRIKDF